MTKTSAQIEKRKRETEKRKKLEKVIRRIASEMPDDDVEQGKTKRSVNPGKSPEKE